MLIPIDTIHKEEEIWLQRYMPLRDLKHWFNNKSCICFTRIDQFNDTLEGWENKYPELNRSWQEFTSYSKRVLNDGGIVESGNCVISRVAQLQNTSKFRGQVGINQINQAIRNYINTIESNYASCWFITEDPFKEKRYMWNIYGKTPKKKAFLLNVKWTDLKKVLEKSEKEFHCGNIDYKLNSTKSPLFRKHGSYSHENEFRIISKDFSNEHDSLQVDINIWKSLVLSEPVSSDKFKELNQIRENELTEICMSKLPIQWKLSELKQLL